jgi:hypothetical protein
LDDAKAPFPLRNTLLLNIDENGTILSQMVYALSAYTSVPACLCRTGDGGLMVSGYIIDYSLSATLFMLQLDCNGAPVWQKQYSFLELGSVNSLFETRDRGYLVGTSGWVGNEGMGIVLKLDADGNIEWQKLTPTQALAAPMGADSYIVTTDTGYFSGPFYSPSNTLIFNLDLNGNVGWAYTLEGLDGPRKILQTGDSGYLLAGTVVDDNSGRDIWLAKLSEAGMLEWQKTIGDEKSEHPSALLQTSGGTYIMAGYSQAAEEKHGDVLVAKLDSTGSIPGCTLIGLGSIMPEGTSISVEDTGMVAQDFLVYVSESFLQPIEVDVQETAICSASQN